MQNNLRLLSWAIFILIFGSCQEKNTSEPKIDRHALVTRHNVILNEPDTLGSLSVGNGEFAFTVDVSGLQTFPDEYESGISLGTQSQWAWHSIPSEKSYTLNDVARQYESCDGTTAPYAVQRNDDEAAKATQVLRSNPHRLHLGLIGFIIQKENGEEAKLSDLKKINQQLDLWSGKIESYYEIEGVPVKVILYSHQENDAIAARMESDLILSKRIKVKVDFPYGKDCHVCPGYDFESPEKHTSELSINGNQATIKRQLDSTLYYTSIKWSAGEFVNQMPHHFEIVPDSNSNQLEFSVLFSREKGPHNIDFASAQLNSETEWKKFWTSGGAIDFSECTDPRAKELERRVVLSQYLTKIQSAGSMPPQETGLTMNSWYGKFHLEMHWWHAAHFPLWGRSEQLEKSMGWYASVLDKAKSTAQWQGYEGARWQKMTDPKGNESPSSVGAFIIWQQPHPIYFAELIYRNNPSDSVLKKYSELVFSTADFMASFVKLKNARLPALRTTSGGGPDGQGKYHLCHPLIPAQEIFRPTETDDPAYELQYWYYGLTVAQEWRKRLGLEPNEKWNDILNNLIELPVSDELYLPNATTPNAYSDDQFRRDHPAVVGAYGFLPYNSRVDTTIMSNTFNNIMNNWQWGTTWGWDYPLLAMTATRLHQPEKAIDALLMDVQKNTYLVNGHNYQDKRLRLYMPGNGGLLAAMALMTAGWDGNKIQNPGFPKNGKWNMKWEGISKMP